MVKFLHFISDTASLAFGTTKAKSLFFRKIIVCCLPAEKQPADTWLLEDPVTSEGFMAEKLSEIVEWETVANEDTIEWRLKP
ncbi:MAG TPA: hypothetical protein PLK58_15220 [Candidatus Rifleibacterium sp.]|nr:hypothetical protein [Candidatus Rifleibacterium sp.]